MQGIRFPRKIGVPLYFAYGTNMDVAAMRRRCPRSRVCGPARLARHRLAVTNEATFTIVRDAHAEVHGVLFDLAIGDVHALDRYEEVGRGAYVKMIQPVLRPAGAPVRALIYVGTSSGGGRARADHLAVVQRAAQALGFPQRYVDALQAFAGGPPRSARFAVS